MSLRIWLPLNGDIDNFGLDSAKPSGNIVYDANGKIGKCGRMDSQLSLVPTSQIYTDNMSISFWIRSTASSPSWHTIIALDNINLSGIHAIYIAEKDRIKYEYNPSINIYSTISEWHHYTFVLSNGKSYGYLDGKLKTTSTEAMTHDLIGRIRIGAATNSMFLNDVRIYDHCLSAKEIKEISKALILNYPMNNPYIEATTNLAYRKTIGFSDGDRWKIVETYPNGITPQGPVYLQTSSNSYFGYGQTFLSQYNTPDYYNNKYLTLSGYYYRMDNSTVTPFISVYGHVISNDNAYTPTVDTYATSNNLTKVGQWTPFFYTVKFKDNLSTTFDYLSYVKSPEGVANKLYLANLQIELSDHATPYTTTPRTQGQEIDCGIANVYDGNINGKIAVVKDSPRYSYSYQFNGTLTGNTNQDDIADLIINDNFLIPTDQITLAYWYKKSAKGYQGGSVFSIDRGANNDYNLYGISTYDGKYRLNTSGGGVEIAPNDSDVLNEWRHHVLTYDGAKFKLYINGVLFQEKVCSGTIRRNQNGLIIGKNTAGGGHRYFNGLMSDFRIYATALSAEDIAELYHSAVIVDNTGKNYAYEYFEA